MTVFGVRFSPRNGGLADASLRRVSVKSLLATQIRHEPISCGAKHRIPGHPQPWHPRLGMPNKDTYYNSDQGSTHLQIPLQHRISYLKSEQNMFIFSLRLLSSARPRKSYF